MDYLREGIEQDIIRYLAEGKKVYVESGAANDRILSYHEDTIVGGIAFETTNCIFPKEIRLSDYNHCDCDDFKGNLFVQVS